MTSYGIYSKQLRLRARNTAGTPDSHCFTVVHVGMANKHLFKLFYWIEPDRK